MKSNENNFKKQWAKIVAKAWSDPAFKKKLIESPNQVLKDHGIELPKNKKYEIVESTPTHGYLILPQKSKNSASAEELSDLSAAGEFDWQSQLD